MEHALSANMKLEKLIVDAMVRTQERLFNALEELEGADEEASGADLVSVAQAVQCAIEPGFRGSCNFSSLPEGGRNVIST
jgi:hypothetical protein